MTSRRRLVSCLGALAGVVLVSCAAKPDPLRRKWLQHLTDARPSEKISAIQHLAPHADKEETTAMVRAAQTSSMDVRLSMAVALGLVDADNAVDLAGAMLRDPSDDVRAAALKTLVTRGGPRAVSYVAHAYTEGGPRLRAVVIGAGEPVLSQAVKAEAKQWHEKIDRRRKDPHDAIRAEALAELGVGAAPSDIAELTARLASDDAVLAAAACDGLTRAGATEAVPQIREAVKSEHPGVRQACAEALAQLDPAHAADVLAPLARPLPSGSAEGLLEILSAIPLSESAKNTLCSVALEHPNGETAAKAARLIGPRCRAPAVLPKEWSLRDTLLVLGSLGVKDAALAKQARALLLDTDARRAAAAAYFLASFGSAGDAGALARSAISELSALDAARADIARRAEVTRADAIASKAAQEEQYRRLLGARYDEVMKLSGPLKGALLKKLGRELGPDVADSFEQRPGSQELIIACVAGAWQLGSDVTTLVASLLAERGPSLRSFAVDLANALGPAGESLRAQARDDVEPWVQRRQAEFDVQAGNMAAIERLATLLPGAEPAERRDMAAALQVVAPKATKLLIALSDGGDVAVPTAVTGLAKVAGAEVDSALLRRLDDPKGVGTRAAIEGLRMRAGAAIDVALVRAAVHPVSDVRAAALAALASRKVCGSAATLRALGDDYVGAVRSAAQALQTACAGNP
jgi:HEAT repeat protein